MLIDLKKIEEARLKIGASRTAEITAELLQLEEYDSKNYKACCPFHAEKTPSFILNQKTMKFHCFGCGKNADLIDVYMHCGMTYIEAVRELFKEADMDFSFGELGIKTNKDYKYPHVDDCGTREQVNKYMGMRGISEKTLDYAGITEDDKGNIVFNYFDTNDVLCLVKYRPSHKIDKSKGETKNWCQKGADTMPLLFNMNKVNVSEPLIITEGESDCLAAIESGFSNAVSVPFGSQNFQWIEHNWEWLEQFSNIIICSDNDEPGVKMRKEIVPRLGSWRTRYIEIPHTYHDEETGKDIPIKDLNEVLYYMGKDAVLKLIENAQDPGVPSVMNISDIQDIDLDEMDGINTGIAELDTEIMRLFYGTLTVVSGLPGCVSCDTEFFNGERWKKISEYEPGDKVLQYNLDRTAELVYPEKYHKYPCDKFYHFTNGTSINQMVSEEHNLVYATKGGKAIKKISVKDALIRHNGNKSGFCGKFINYFDYSGNGIDMTDDEIRLTCAVIADGTFNNRYSEDTYSYKKCRINIKKEAKKERLKQLLDNCGIEYKEHVWNNTDKGYRNFVFIPPIRTKKFPKNWYNCSKHQFEVIAEEIPKWDGHKYKETGSISFSSTDKDNADFVQFVYSSLGYRSSMYIDNRVGKNHSNNKYLYKSIVYNVNVVCKKNKYSSMHSSSGKHEIQECASKDGFKYCFTVPSGMLVLRYKDTINITGNSGKTSFLCQLCCQSLEQGKPVWMFSREMPGWMEKSWLNYIMAGGNNIKAYEDKNGARYYKVTQEAKAQINEHYSNKWFLYRDDWSNKLDDLLLSMEDSVRKYGTKLLIIDNLMTVDLESNENSVLLKQTECINRLIKFAMKFSVCIVLVAHPRKMPKGEEVGMYDISGTSNIINLAHRSIGLRRIDKDKEQCSHDVCLTLIKDRMRGRAGKRVNMYYDVPTRRFYTNEKEYNFQYSWDKKIHPPLKYPHEDEQEVYGEC